MAWITDDNDDLQPLGQMQATTEQLESWVRSADEERARYRRRNQELNRLRDWNQDPESVLGPPPFDDGRRIVRPGAARQDIPWLDHDSCTTNTTFESTTDISFNDPSGEILLKEIIAMRDEVIALRSELTRANEKIHNLEQFREI